jgi:hypothetical protein
VVWYGTVSTHVGNNSHLACSSDGLAQSTLALLSETSGCTGTNLAQWSQESTKELRIVDF